MAHSHAARLFSSCKVAILACGTSPTLIIAALSVTGGDLWTYLNASPDRVLAPWECKWISFQLFNALKYLHEDAGIAHRGACAPSHPFAALS